MEKEYKPGTPKTDRNKAIYQMRQDGATLAEIGKRFSIGKERARQIYLREERRERYMKFKKRNGTRPLCDSIEWEIKKLDNITDKRSMSGQLRADRLTEQQKKTISERILFLEQYKEIIEG